MNVISKWLKGIKEDSLSQNQIVMMYDFPEIYISLGKPYFGVNMDIST